MVSRRMRSYSQKCRASLIRAEQSAMVEHFDSGKSYKCMVYYNAPQSSKIPRESIIPDFAEGADWDVAEPQGQPVVQPFTGSSHTINEVVVAQNVTPSMLRSKPEGMREAGEARTSILPHRNEVFGTPSFVERAKRHLRRDVVPEATQYKLVESRVGELYGASTLQSSIPLIPEREDVVVDDRLPMRQRMQDQLRFVRVGALEITFDGIAAVGSDARVAGVLYDARHSRNCNAVLGAFIASAAQVPTRALFSLPCRLPLLPEINEYLRVALISPDSDMEGHMVGALRSSIVAQYDHGSHQEIMTRGQIRREIQDRALAVEYVNKHCLIVTPGGKPLSLDFGAEIPLERFVGARQSVDGMECYVREREPFRFSSMRSVPTRKETTQHYDKGVGQALEPLEICNNFVGLPDLAESDDRHLYTTHVELPLEVMHGKVLASIQMKDILAGTGKLNRMLSLAPQVPNKLEIQLNCKIPELSGVGIGVAFLQHEHGGGAAVHVKALGPTENYLWNPAMEPQLVMHVSPSSLGSWSPLWMEVLNPTLYIFGLSAWVNPPKTSAVCEVKVRLSREMSEAKIINLSVVPNSLEYRRYMGLLEFKQGVHADPTYISLNLGTPVLSANGYTPTMPDAILSLASCWSADMVFAVHRLGSSFVGATFACAILAGSKIDTVEKKHLNEIPHVKFVVARGQTGVTFVMPRKLMGWAAAAERKALIRSERKGKGLMLAIWVVDSVTSTTTGDLTIAITCEALRNLVLYGNGYGYERTKGQANLQERLPDYDRRVLTSFCETGWHEYCHRIFKDEETGTEDISIGFSPGSTLPTGWESRESGLTRVIRTAYWWSGDLEIKIIWCGKKGIKMSDRTSQIMCGTDWDSKGSLLSDCYASWEPSGERILTISFSGPCKGFAYMGKNIHDLAAYPAINVCLQSRKEYSSCVIMFRPLKDFEISGPRPGVARNMGWKPDECEYISA